MQLFSSITLMLVAFVALFTLNAIASDESMCCKDQEERLRKLEQQMFETNEKLKTCNNLNARVNELQLLNSTSINRGKRGSSEGNVAFSLLTMNQDHIGLGQVIKFNEVIINDGNGYSVTSGVFVAPVTGVYLFIYHLANYYKIGQVWFELMHNGAKVNAAVADALHDHQDVQGSNSAILRVLAGDSVWLQSWHQDNAHIYGAQDFTSFSGTLLYY